MKKLLTLVVISSLLFSHLVYAKQEKVVICHATSSEGNPYVAQEPSASGDVSGHDDHENDIIPPFDYDGGHYEGKNWTSGQATWENDCNVPEVVLPPPPVPVLGCMDQTATNYNPLATEDDGSCEFTEEPPTEQPPVEEPPVETPPVETPPAEVPPAETPLTPPSGGGGSNPVSFASSVPSTSGSAPAVQLPVIEPQVLGASCVAITDFEVDTGISGDGRVRLNWAGGNDTKFVVYGPSVDSLSYLLLTDSEDGIEITNLPGINHWFAVSNGCSASPLIDPIP